MATIGKHLRKLRKEAGLSYRKLGAAVGVSHNNLAVYEKDKFGPSLEIAVRIAKFFDVPLEYLLYGEKAQFRYRDIELMELFALADELSEEYRTMVKDYIRQVVAHSRERERLREKSRSLVDPQEPESGTVPGSTEDKGMHDAAGDAGRR